MWNFSLPLSPSDYYCINIYPHGLDSAGEMGFVQRIKQNLLRLYMHEAQTNLTNIHSRQRLYGSQGALSIECLCSGIHMQRLAFPRDPERPSKNIQSTGNIWVCNKTKAKRNTNLGQNSNTQQHISCLTIFALHYWVTAILNSGFWLVQKPRFILYNRSPDSSAATNQAMGKYIYMPVSIATAHSHQNPHLNPVCVSVMLKWIICGYPVESPVSVLRKSQR